MKLMWLEAMTQVCPVSGSAGSRKFIAPEAQHLFFLLFEVAKELT
jgi:hypothetical protein